MFFHPFGSERIARAGAGVKGLLFVIYIKQSSRVLPILDERTSYHANQVRKSQTKNGLGYSNRLGKERYYKPTHFHPPNQFIFDSTAITVL